MLVDHETTPLRQQHYLQPFIQHLYDNAPFTTPPLPVPLYESNSATKPATMLPEMTALHAACLAQFHDPSTANQIRTAPYLDHP